MPLTLISPILSPMPSTSSLSLFPEAKLSLCLVQEQSLSPPRIWLQGTLPILWDEVN